MTETKLPFPDISKIVEQFKLPGIDLQSILEARRADIDALRQANAIAMAGAQRVAEKQAEIFRQSLTEITGLLKDLPNQASNPSGLVGKQTELAQTALTRTFGHMRELAETVQKSQAEVVEVLNKRAQENMAELKKLMKIG